MHLIISLKHCIIVQLIGTPAMMTVSKPFSAASMWHAECLDGCMTDVSFKIRLIVCLFFTLEKHLVLLRDGRTLIGILRSIDQFGM